MESTQEAYSSIGCKGKIKITEESRDRG